jgi:hypothetical protein
MEKTQQLFEGSITMQEMLEHPGAIESAPELETETITVETLESSVPALAEVSRHLSICDDESCAKVIVYGQSLKEKKRQVNELFNPRIAQAHDLHSGLCGDKRRFLEPLLEAEKVCQESVAEYHEVKERERLQLLAELQERERLEAEELARLERELQSESDAEALRLASQVVDDAVIDAAAAEAVGDVEAADAILSRAAVTVEEIQQTAMPMPNGNGAARSFSQSAPTKFGGAAVKTKYSAEVINLKLLCLAIGQGRVPVTAVEPKMSVLNSWAKSMGDSFQIDGVRRVALKTARFT